MLVIPIRFTGRQSEASTECREPAFLFKRFEPLAQRKIFGGKKPLRLQRFENEYPSA